MSFTSSKKQKTVKPDRVFLTLSDPTVIHHKNMRFYPKKRRSQPVLSCPVLSCKTMSYVINCQPLKKPELYPIKWTSPFPEFRVPLPVIHPRFPDALTADLYLSEDGLLYHTNCHLCNGLHKIFMNFKTEPVTVHQRLNWIFKVRRISSAFMVSNPISLMIPAVSSICLFISLAALVTREAAGFLCLFCGVK